MKRDYMVRCLHLKQIAAAKKVSCRQRLPQIMKLMAITFMDRKAPEACMECISRLHPAMLTIALASSLYITQMKSHVTRSGLQYEVPVRDCQEASKARLVA